MIVKINTWKISLSIFFSLTCIMSAWLEHVKATMKLFPGKPLKEVLKEAKHTYKKGVSVVKYAVTGKKSHKKSKSKSNKKSKSKSRKHSRGGKRKGKRSRRGRSSRRRR